MALTTVIVKTLAVAIDRLGIPRALKTLRDETEVRLAAIETAVDAQDAMPSVRMATAGALPAYTRVGNVITADANGAAAAVDVITPVAGDDILLKNGAAGADNGIYTYTSIGGGASKFVLTRRTDANTSAEVTSMQIVGVSEGTVHGGERWFLSTIDAIVLNTTALTYVQMPSLVDLASVASGLGSALIGSEDVGTFFAGATVEAILQEIGATTGAAVVGLLDTLGIITATDVEGALAEAAAEMNTHRPGVPMIGRVIMLGAPGKIVQGDTVTIGADVYEFRDDTPPTGGAGPNIWVFNGANSAASRANFIKAVNGVVDAALIANSVATETLLAVAGTTVGTVDIRSAAAVGGAIAPSGTATATTEVLTTATDIWDDTTMYAGKAQAATQLQMTTVTLTAAEVTAGFLEVEFDFTPVSVILVNRSRPQVEAYVITADRIVLTLAGGATPDNQAADVIDLVALG